MQERVCALELKYQRYLRKRLLKALLLGTCFLGLGIFAYLAFEFYEKERALNAKLIEEKRALQSKINAVKIKEEKMKLSKKLNQDLAIKEQKDLKPIKKISIKASTFDLVSLKKSYYQNPSLEKALLLSHLYLDNKDYKKSIFWSLKANELDKSAKESWVLFARARAGLGEDEAEILRLYSHYYESIQNP